jgi:predicted RNase H-like nuclease (RuvC/YqgF family)
MDSQEDGLKSLQSALEQQGTLIEQFGERLSAQTKTLDQLGAQWDETRAAEQANASTEEDASVADLAAFKQSQSQAMASLKQQLEQQQRSLSTLGERVTTALEQSSARQVSGGIDKAELESEVARQMDARLATLSKTQSSLSSQVGELRRQQTALDAGLEAQGQNSQGDSDASEQLRSLDASRRQLTGRVASMLSQISQLEQRVARLER